LTTPLDRDRLLRFFANAGFKVHRTANAGWYEAGPRFLLGVPTHMPLAIDAAEAREALRATGALGVRYVSARPTEGAESWQMLASGVDYDLEKFSGNTRSKVRRGLKNNEIRRISGDELMRTGEQAFLDTVKRQGRADRYGIDRWHALLRAADADSGIEIWAAWHEGVMAAYLLTMVFADNCELYEARSRDDTLKHYPNNALIYQVTRHLLVERARAAASHLRHRRPRRARELGSVQARSRLLQEARATTRRLPPAAAHRARAASGAKRARHARRAQGRLGVLASRARAAAVRRDHREARALSVRDTDELTT
jgi:hypothetical protein